MNKTHLAIFDLDGTLFNTEDVNYYSYKTALAEYGIDLDKNHFVSECNGRHYKVFLTPLIKNVDDIEKVHNRKKDLYSSFLDKAKINIHLFNIIKNIANEYHTAIVTTASRKNAEEILNHFNVSHLFDLVLTQEYVTKKKPDPEGFVKAMDYFKAQPTNTLIFEDSDVGIKAAEATGASVMVINNF